MDVDRRNQAAPGYRPPMAVGQQYPPLGYGPTGAPRFTVDPETPPEQVVPQPVAEPVPVPTGPPPRNPQGMRALVGAASIVAVLVLLLAGYKLFGGGDDADTVPPRADPPASQNVDDPYLPKSIEPTETVPGETRRPSAGAAVAAELSVQAPSGSTILYIDDGRIVMGVMASDTWTRSVTSDGRFRVSVLPRGGGQASCSITVDGKRIAESSTAPGADGATVTCQGAS